MRRVISLKKVEQYAKKSHNSCMGRGFTGYNKDGIIICPCVKKNLMKLVTNPHDKESLWAMLKDDVMKVEEEVKVDDK